MQQPTPAPSADAEGCSHPQLRDLLERRYRRRPRPGEDQRPPLRPDRRLGWVDLGRGRDRLGGYVLPVGWDEYEYDAGTPAGSPDYSAGAASSVPEYEPVVEQSTSDYASSEGDAADGYGAEAATESYEAADEY